MRDNNGLFLTQMMRPLSKFLDDRMRSILLLFSATIIAFIWANSSYSGSYYALWDTLITVSIGRYGISNSLGHWINDALMAYFFFVIGLEIKRELLVGELSSIENAILPAIAAVGGMIFPALIYLLLNQGGPGHAGWGIPMATDIAFALACLTALGASIPLALKVFLMALAIFDDMGAILVIALFYTEQISLVNLGFGFIILLVSAFLNFKGVRKTYPYALLGVALWVTFFLSGIHATIAGVLLAFTIPARARHNQAQFISETEGIINSFPNRDFHLMCTDGTQRKMMKKLKVSVDNLDSPLQKLEDKLYPFVNYLVLPVFALANAGVNLSQGNDAISSMSPVFWGIVAGLVIGKPIGITFLSWLAVRFGMAQLPSGIMWMQIWAMSCLAGIGFTMSLFITNLAFFDPMLIHQAKLAIIIGSILSAFLGMAVFFLFNAIRRAE